MPSPVDLYDNAYARVEHDLYRLIRTDTYGQDLGQTSWVSTEESDRLADSVIAALVAERSHERTCWSRANRPAL